MKLKNSRNEVAFELQRSPCLFQWNIGFLIYWYSKPKRLTVNFSRHPTALLNTLKYLIKSSKASEKRYWEITKKMKREMREGRREEKTTHSYRRADVRVENRWGTLTIVKRERSCLVRALFSCEWAEKRKSLSSPFTLLFKLLLSYKSMFWLLRLLTWVKLVWYKREISLSERKSHVSHFLCSKPLKIKSCKLSEALSLVHQI